MDLFIITTGAVYARFCFTTIVWTKNILTEVVHNLLLKNLSEFQPISTDFFYGDPAEKSRISYRFCWNPFSPEVLLQYPKIFSCDFSQHFSGISTEGYLRIFLRCFEGNSVRINLVIPLEWCLTQFLTEYISKWFLHEVFILCRR